MEITDGDIPLSKQIRIMRSIRGLSQGELAQRAGLSQFLVSYFENGHAASTPA